MRGRCCTVLVIAAHAWILLSAASAKVRAIDSIGKTGGDLTAVCVERNLACLAKGSSLLIVDLSDPSHPKRIGEAALPGVIQEVAWADTRSVLLAGESIGLVHVDLADLAQPRIVGSAPIKSKPIRLKVSAGKAFVLGIMGALEIFDVKSASGPVFSASHSMEGPLRDFDFENEIGCGTSPLNPNYPNGRPEPPPPPARGKAPPRMPVTSRGYCVLVYRMEGGRKPVRSSVLELSGYPSQITLSDGIGAVSVREGVELIDIRDASKPVSVSFLPEKTVSGRCAISGSLLFVPGSRPAALTIYDISNPNEPRKVGTYESEGASGVAVNGGMACLLSSTLEVLDILDPGAPKLSGKVEEAFAPERIIVRNRTIYAADSSSRLVILDAANPSCPTELGETRLAAKAQTLAVSGTYVFAGCGGYGLNVVDASNPASVRLIKVMPKVTNPSRILLQGDYAYVSAKAGIYVLDIKRPEDPEIISLYSAEQNIQDVGIQGSLVYAAGGATGLHIIGVDYPLSPVFLGLKQTPRGSSRITLSDKMAYVWQQSGELLCFDLKDPMNPTLAGQIERCRSRIKVSGNSLYASNYKLITAMSLADPASPEPFVEYSCSGASDFDLDDQFLYVADTSAGLRVFKLAED
jgi:hypothetical protein